ncbi:MAG: TonB family protein [Sphaerochaeta sp.]
MNILRAILITLLVTAASLGALLIPLNSTSSVERPPTATGATISLVDSLPSAQASIPPVPEQPKTTRVKTEAVKAPVSTPTTEKPLPISDEGVAVVDTNADPKISLDTDSNTDSSPDSEQLPMVAEDPAQPPPLQEEPAAATETSLASVAVSAFSLDPLPSLVDGYYEATGIDQGPSFNRTALASKIKYPSLAKRQGMEGLVMLRLFISASGKVERIEVEEDPGYGLAEAAVKAFTGMQGEPALLGGKAVPVTLRYPVRFSLE